MPAGNFISVSRRAASRSWSRRLPCTRTRRVSSFATATRTARLCGSRFSGASLASRLSSSSKNSRSLSRPFAPRKKWVSSHTSVFGCGSEGVAHPVIVSEGGRAIVAHHSVLVMEAFSSIEKTAPKLRVEATEKDHKLVRDILDVKQRLKRGNRMESLHDIEQIKEEV